MVDELTVGGLTWEDLRVLPLSEEIKLTPSIVRSKFDNGHIHAEKFVDVLTQQAQQDKAHKAKIHKRQTGNPTINTKA
ncbi:type 2 periplasmic-binding domain-containing protein [Candidimonas nitroreducens]|uniref:hypothetical protein n=1 Tax=Candidimonas nitroreducens TaxID=683354 RepID=UPI001E32EF1D|nr:hypothetical protein [Candidimonas nitroreducens]